MTGLEFIRPQTVDEALACLRDLPGARLVAGGQWLVPALRRSEAKATFLVGLDHLDSLKAISREGDMLVIGAGATHADIAGSALVREAIPALAALAGAIGDRQVRHRGTIGGAIGSHDPLADYWGALLALDAAIETSGRTVSADGVWSPGAEGFPVPGEMILRVRLPIPKRAAYEKAAHPASGQALVSVFVAEMEKGWQSAAVGVNDRPVRIPLVEVSGAPAFAGEADTGGGATTASGRVLGVHASAAYRAALFDVLLRRAVARLSG